MGKPRHQNFDSFCAAPNKLAGYTLYFLIYVHLSWDGNESGSQNLVRGKPMIFWSMDKNPPKGDYNEAPTCKQVGIKGIFST